MEKWNRNLASVCNGVETSGSREEQMKQYHEFMTEQYNNSEGNLHEEDGYHCDICKNKGKIRKVLYAEGLGYWAPVEHDCACMEIRRNLKRLRSCGLKDVIEQKRFETYRTDEPWQKTVKTMAQNYVENIEAERKWFFVGGNTGAGKSHICTAICRELILRGKEVRYMMWRDESVRLKALLNDDAAYQNIIREIKQAEVLYIDDFFKSGQNGSGSQNVTDADIKLAFEILNYRSNNPDAITILSSESTLAEILNMDGATGGRIGEMAGEYIINLTGDKKNHRKKMMGIAV